MFLRAMQRKIDRVEKSLEAHLCVLDICRREEHFSLENKSVVHSNYPEWLLPPPACPCLGCWFLSHEIPHHSSQNHPRPPAECAKDGRQLGVQMSKDIETQSQFWISCSPGVFATQVEKVTNFSCDHCWSSGCPINAVDNVKYWNLSKDDDIAQSKTKTIVTFAVTLG